MIEHLDGIHETVTYKENSSLRLFVNTDCEDYPIHWHTPMEIIMPLEGTYTVFLGDKPVLLQEGRHYFHLPWDPSLSCGTGKRKTNYSAD